MSDISNGVDAPFIEGSVTPFVSPSSKIIAEVEKEQFGEVESNKSLLNAPKADDLPEKGRLNQLHTEYVAEPNEEKLNRLLTEVERYARRVTLGKGGKYARQLTYSATDRCPATETSQNVMLKVWRSLDKFDGKSKFSVWVFRIAQNDVKDAIRSIIHRSECEFHDWRNNSDPDDFIGVSDGDRDIGHSHGRTPVPEIHRPDPEDVRIAELDGMLAGLPGQDQEIITMFREGSTPAEIGKAFRKNAKWASNQLNRIKKLLKKQADLAKQQTRRVIVMKKETNPLPASKAAD